MIVIFVAFTSKSGNRHQIYIPLFLSTSSASAPKDVPLSPQIMASSQSQHQLPLHSRAEVLAPTHPDSPSPESSKHLPSDSSADNTKKERQLLTRIKRVEAAITRLLDVQAEGPAKRAGLALVIAQTERAQLVRELAQITYVP